MLATKPFNPMKRKLAMSFHNNQSESGFTLLELMIAVAVIGILAAIAFPSYQQYVLKSRRTDAMAGLVNLQQDIEKWRVNNASYAGCTICSAPASDYYTFAISSETATNYTLTATAQSSQTADTGCTSLTLNQNGTKSPPDCWSK